IEATKEDLGSDAPVVVLDGWNVTVKDTSAGGVRVMPNAEALVSRASSMPAEVKPSHIVSINCGGPAPGFYTFGNGKATQSADGFVADTDFTGGSIKTVGDAIGVSAPNAAPQAVYQSERWGACTYAVPLPPLPPGQAYTVRLHFAETTYHAAGQRRFNVDINGRQVLTEYDVFADAGGADKAVVKDFPGFAPDRNGRISLAFTRGSIDEPKISGIQIFPAPGTAVANVESPQNWTLGPFVKADAANPVLAPQNTRFDDPMTGKSLGWEQDNVFNPAAIVRNGEVCLLYRAEDDSGAGVGQHTSRIGLAESADGLHFTRRAAPVLFPANDDQKTTDWPGGDEDPRIVETDDGGYILTYTAWNRQTARLSVATSRDLIHWDKRGPAFSGPFRDLWSKSGAIVTRRVGDHLIAAKINGKYWMYWGEGIVSVATSPDLVHWTPVLDAKGAPVPILAPRPGLFDSALCESGPPAVLTAKGILLLYNGKNSGGLPGPPVIKAGAYSGGQALFDPQDPAHLIARSDRPFFYPERPYETSGQYAAGTVFLEGLVYFHGHWQLYYGTADSHVATAITSVSIAAEPGIPALPRTASGRTAGSLPRQSRVGRQ
ncbi:MAG: malectin domain-containing carbohydrate-binding protein, partial [Armatimonadota bacterium]|nr:malectin domain-containing carbohydrate-binding protein [Armatimonadota bacterium]